MSKSVQEYIEKLIPEHRKIAETLRKTIKEADPEIEEAIKWNQPCYSKDGMICGFMAAKTHVTLAFHQGAKLKDPKRLLEGTGKLIRHIKLKNANDVPVNTIKEWVKECVKLNSK